MLTSMTGFGAANAEEQGIICGVEIRAVNNRYFKGVIKLPDKLVPLESEIDRLLRETVARGSLVTCVTVKDQLSSSSVQINQQVLGIYIDQAKVAYHLLAEGINKVENARVDVAALLSLPGVIEAGANAPDYVETHRELILRVVKEAVLKLHQMRQREGAALWADLQKHLTVIREALGKIHLLAPKVVTGYHEKLKQRVTQMVNDSKMSFNDDDLLREVALFADRADISEEIQRLGGHLDQFGHVCTQEDQGGRKLDFISQEMLREANTIASKAGDSAIARLTVDIKSAIDRIKEQVQNVE